MKNLDTVAKELFNKIRGRFPSVTVGNESAEITNDPNTGRFFEFDFVNGKKVSVSLDEKDLTIMYSRNLFAEHEDVLKTKWFDFMKEMRTFAKKRMLNFDTRDITKSNLDKRDYEYLSTEKTMSESKLYGTSRTSYQDIGTARMIVKHSAPVNQESVTGRNTNIHSIYIESEGGERFKYPYKHMNGARAMARHVSEGGNPYDDFGKHISGLSEELSNLRKFKTYMNRSSVMAEGLAQYMDVVNDRIATVKKTVESLQKQTGYAKTFENFESTVLEEVPEDVTANWIDELTIRQFNEELKSVFPYIYKLIGEANATVELGPQDLLGEEDDIAAKVRMFISKSEYPEQAIETLMKSNTPEGKYIQREYEITAGENGLHGDDDHETIIDMMVQEIGVAEGEKSDYDAKKKALQDIQNDPNTAEDEELQKELMRRKAELEKTKEDTDDIDERSEYEKYRTMRVVYDPETLEVKKTYPMMHIKQSTADADRMGLVATDGTQYLELRKKKKGMDAESIIDMEADYSAHLDDVISNSKHETNPQEEYERAFEDFKMAAANAAAKGEKDFEYPKGSGKKHPVKMDKGTAAKMLADAGEEPTTIDISPKGPGDELKAKNEIPLDEFIKSLYDYTTNSFPKGETAVLTQVQKQYGDEAIDEAQQVMAELLQGADGEMAQIQQLAGLR